jgi:hypothetical protein
VARLTGRSMPSSRSHGEARRSGSAAGQPDVAADALERLRPTRPLEREIDDESTDKILSGFTELFFSAERPLDRPILFHHIQKTAGTALRKFIRSALPPSQRLVRQVENLSAQPREALLAWHRDWYESLTERQRDELCCAMAHSANYLLPAMDRPVLAITLVRDPVDRVVSQYYRRKSRRGNPLVPDPLSPPPSARKAKTWTLADAFEYFSGRSPRDVGHHGWVRSFNGQSRSLLAPHYDVGDLILSNGPPPDADLWRERLFTLMDETYTVGVQERFEEFVGRLAAMFGCEPWLPRAKVNRSRPAVSELPDTLRETILAHNWLDTELHAYARDRARA